MKLQKRDFNWIVNVLENHQDGTFVAKHFTRKEIKTLESLMWRVPTKQAMGDNGIFYLDPIDLLPSEKEVVEKWSGKRNWIFKGLLLDWINPWRRIKKITPDTIFLLAETYISQCMVVLAIIGLVLVFNNGDMTFWAGEGGDEFAAGLATLLSFLPLFVLFPFVMLFMTDRAKGGFVRNLVVLPLHTFTTRTLNATGNTAYFIVVALLVMLSLCLIGGVWKGVTSLMQWRRRKNGVGKEGVWRSETCSTCGSERIRGIVVLNPVETAGGTKHD